MATGLNVMRNRGLKLDDRQTENCGELEAGWERINYASGWKQRPRQNGLWLECELISGERQSLAKARTWMKQWLMKSGCQDGSLNYASQDLGVTSLDSPV